MEGPVGEADALRIAEQIRTRLGFVSMPPEQGLELLDAALGMPDPLLVPVAFDAAVLRSQGSAGTLPAVLRGLVRVPVRSRVEAGSLAEQLAGVPEADRASLALNLVRTHVATVLGHASGEEIDPEKAFKDLGFDSLAAVELRNRLVAASGLRLAPTIVFDYPSARALADHLIAEVGLEGVAKEDEGDAFRRALALIPVSRLREAGLMEPLLDLIDAGGELGGPARSDPIAEIDSMDLEDLVERTLDESAAEPGVEVEA